MKKLGFVVLFLMFVSISGVLAQDVTYNFAQGADFSRFKTYKLVSIKNAAQVDQITANQLTAAIDAELAKKGLTKTDSDNADLYVGYQTAITSEQEINAYATGWGYGPGWRYGYGYGGPSMVTATTTTIPIGTLDLDMYDSAKKELVWRGKATKTLDPKAKPDKRAKSITKGVAKLLKNYPPKAK